MPLRALIVEENHKVNEQLRDALEMEGFDTEISMSLEMALEILSSRRMDLLVINPFPEKDRIIESLKTIEKQAENIPVAAIIPENCHREIKRKFGKVVSLYKVEDVDFETLAGKCQKLARENLA